MPAFGTALEEHLKRSNREIALPIEACVMMLLETGMHEEVFDQTRDSRTSISKHFNRSVTAFIVFSNTSFSSFDVFVVRVLHRQGLFRITAGASKLKKLKAALDCSTSQLEELDPHAVAGTLSSYCNYET